MTSEITQARIVRALEILLPLTAAIVLAISLL